MLDNVDSSIRFDVAVSHLLIWMCTIFWFFFRAALYESTYFYSVHFLCTGDTYDMYHRNLFLLSISVTVFEYHIPLLLYMDEDIHTKQHLFWIHIFVEEQDWTFFNVFFTTFVLLYTALVSRTCWLLCFQMSYSTCTRSNGYGVFSVNLTLWYR